MAIQAVVEAIRQDFEKSGCPAKVLFGHRYLGQHDAPQRVVFVETSDTFEAPVSIGNVPTGNNPRAILKRRVGFEAHIWAAAAEQPNGSSQHLSDDIFLDKLVNQVCLSLYNVAPGNNQSLSGQRKADDYQNRGIAYILKGTIDVPIVDIDWPSWGIDTNAKTWNLVSDVDADVTVQELSPDQPPVVLGSVTFSTGDS